MNEIGILIVEDHPIVREGLKLIFEMEDHFKILDEASNGKEALDFIRNKKYDLILLDISMPVMDGMEFLQEKENLGDDTKVVILTTVDDRETINRAMEFGVNGFMLKDSTRVDMLRTTWAAIKNEVYISEEIRKILSEEVKQQDVATQTEDSLLTEREAMVLTRVVQGAASKEIAIDMGITERTVKAHLTSIYRKLGVNSRAEAVAYAIVRKIVAI
jgi:NarL family two-component system response regulator YdfI